MTHNHLAVLKLPPAPRGSKKGWPLWAGQVDAQLHERLIALLGERHRGDLVAEALAEYATKRERKGERRKTERRRDAA